MNIKTKAYLVHLFTASGAVFAMLALLEAVQEDWAMMFFWLVVAFAVDGFDGPLARKYDVTTNAPRIDGVLLDLIIDYLTYVFIPAFALFKSGLLPGWTGWFAIIVITFMSAIYFADNRMKTSDYSFSGFPGCWNMVVLVLFALEARFRGDPVLCRGAGGGDADADQVRSSVSHGALAGDHFADGLWLDLLCGLGGLGGFRPAELGALGLDPDDAMAVVRGRGAAGDL